MSDLISRQDAIDTIEAKEANEFGNYLEYNVAFNDGLRSAVYAIEDLPSAQQWIPCSERLPNSNGCYLVWRPHFFGGEIGMPSICYFDGQNTWHDSYGVDFERVLSSDDVTAWMTLPEPYSGADMRKGETDD